MRTTRPRLRARQVRMHNARVRRPLTLRNRRASDPTDAAPLTRGIRLSVTDNFDMLTPMVDWIENGVAPDEIVATGNRFPASVGPYAGLGNTTRSRQLCAYPKTLRYSGSGDISQASSEHGHDRDDDDDDDEDHDRHHSHH